MRRASKNFKGRYIRKVGREDGRGNLWAGMGHGRETSETQTPVLTSGHLSSLINHLRLPFPMAVAAVEISIPSWKIVNGVDGKYTVRRPHESWTLLFLPLWAFSDMSRAFLLYFRSMTSMCLTIANNGSFTGATASVWRFISKFVLFRFLLSSFGTFSDLLCPYSLLIKLV